MSLFVFLALSAGLAGRAFHHDIKCIKKPRFFETPQLWKTEIRKSLILRNKKFLIFWKKVVAKNLGFLGNFFRAVRRRFLHLCRNSDFWFFWKKKRCGRIARLLLYERRSTREAGEVIVKYSSQLVCLLFITITPSGCAIHPFFHKEGDTVGGGTTVKIKPNDTSFAFRKTGSRAPAGWRLNGLWWSACASF